MFSHSRKGLADAKETKLLDCFREQFNAKTGAGAATITYNVVKEAEVVSGSTTKAIPKPKVRHPATHIALFTVRLPQLRQAQARLPHRPLVLPQRLRRPAPPLPP